MNIKCCLFSGYAAWWELWGFKLRLLAHVCSFCSINETYMQADRCKDKYWRTITQNLIQKEALTDISNKPKMSISHFKAILKIRQCQQYYACFLSLFSDNRLLCFIV